MKLNPNIWCNLLKEKDIAQLLIKTPDEIENQLLYLIGLPQIPKTYTKLLTLNKMQNLLCSLSKHTTKSFKAPE